MNGACDMCVRGVKFVQGFGGEKMYDLGVNGSMILKCILYKSNGRTWTGFIWLWLGLFVCDNKLLCSLKCS